MTTGCESTLTRKAKRKGQGKYQNQKGTRTSKTSNTDINGTLGERLLETRWRSTHKSNNSNTKTNKGKNNKKGKDKGKQLDVVLTSSLSETASTVSYPSQTPSTIDALWCNPDVQQKGGIMTLGGVTINSLSSTRRQAGAEYVLLNSGAQLRACPVKYPGQRIPFA